MYRFYTLYHVPTSKRSERAWFEVLKAITLYCTVLELIAGNFIAVWFSRVVGRFTLMTKKIWINGDLNNHRTCKWSYTVIIFPSYFVTAYPVYTATDCEIY